MKSSWYLMNDAILQLVPNQKQLKSLLKMVLVCLMICLLFLKKPDSVLKEKNGFQLAMFSPLVSKRSNSSSTVIILQHSSQHLVLV